LLHLTAFDAEDLGVISAQMQDAVVRFADITYRTRQRRFAFVANRFAWDALPGKERRRSGISFNDVTRVRRQGPAAPHGLTVLSLLAITFASDGKPDSVGGTITLTFSGGHAVALDVDCIDVSLDDLGPAWSTEMTPEHTS
jgi:hypothetical protein